MTRKRSVLAAAARILLAGAVMLVLLAGIAGYFYGEKLLWSTLLPTDARLVGPEVPRQLPAKAWQEDVRFLQRELPLRIPQFGEVVDAQGFAKSADSAAAAMVTENRVGRELALMKLANVPMNPGYGGGHTQVPAFQRPLNWAYYPFYAYPFEDGIWVTLSAGHAVEARGARILEMNGVPVEEVMRRGAPFVSADNAHSRRERLAALLSWAGFLRGLHVVPEDGTLELVMRSGTGDSLRVMSEPARLFSWGGLQWGKRLQQPVHTWSPADPRPRTKNYFFEYRQEKGLIYLQFNRVQDMEGESIEDFAQRLEMFVDGHEIKRFVVDLRSNGGGNNQLLEPLLTLLSGHPKINRYGVLYTLIGRRTYSAAGAFACALERRTRTLFAGEPSGFTPNHVGDAVRIPLPESRLLVAVSSRYWEDGGPFGKRRWLEPDLQVPLRASDHFSDHDPALKAVLNHRAGDPGEAVSSGLPAGLAGRYRFGAYKVLEMRLDSTGGSEWVITGVDTWASSGLYTSGTDPNRFATDLRGVYLEWEEGTLTVDWRGSAHPLRAMDPGELSPIEILKALPGEEVTLDAVERAFRRGMGAGERPDSHTELLMNRIGYELLRTGRTAEAVRLFRLMTELFPTVPNAFDSLGDGYLAAGEREEAREAFRRALELNPGFDHPREMLEAMNGEE